MPANFVAQTTIMKRYHLLLLSLLFLFSCKDVPHQGSRYGMVTGLRPEKIDEYKSLHAKVWPDVLKTIKACNIHNYSIYLKNIDDRWYLFSYFEYTGKDFNEDMEKMKKDSITRQWWKVTAPCQLPLPDAAAKGETWSGMEEVFHAE